MRQIKLHGELGKRFGTDWTLDIRNPGEAIRAIQANKPGFVPHMLESEKSGVGYRVIVGDTDIQAEAIPQPFGREVLHIVPVVAGAKSGGLGMIILGAALIVVTAGFATPFVAGAAAGTFGAMSIASIGLNIGIGLILSGVAQMLVKTPKPADIGSGPNPLESYYFNGPNNTGSQGSPVPIGYGRMLVGSIPISSSISSQNI